MNRLVPTLFVLGCAAIVPVELTAQAAAPVANGSHIVFVGLNVSLDFDDGTRPVVDADNASVHVDANGRRVRIPLRHVTTIKTDAAPKVGTSSLTLAEVRTDRAFSRGSDPKMRAAAQQMLMISAQQAAEDEAFGAMKRAEEAVSVAAVSQAAAVAAAEQAGLPVYATGPSADQLSSLNSAASDLSSAFSGNMFSGNLAGNGLGGTADQMDAFQVTFMASSPSPVSDAYGVLRLYLRVPGDEELKTAIRFFNVPALGPVPRKITSFHEGLPPGFAVDRYELHIYSDGRELATNLSTNRIELNTADVHQFLMLLRQTQSAGGNAPVEIASEMLANDLRSHIPSEEQNRAVDVVVNAAGELVSVEIERDGWAGPFAYIESVIRESRFLPALVKGKPVQDNARFFLSDFIP